MLFKVNKLKHGVEQMKYKTAQAWKRAAMQRPQGVSDVEMVRRKQQACDHVLQNGGKASGDIWEDYMLYITGRMEEEEYQSYLLFKHSSVEG